MDKSYRRNLVNRQRRNYYGYGSKRRNKKSSNILRKILIQILVSILIVSIIILLKNIDSAVGNNTSSFIKKVMYTEFNYKKSINIIKEYAIQFKDYASETIPVFKKTEGNFKMSPPINGIIISSYGKKLNPITEKQTFQRGIDIKAIDIDIVKSVENGVVILTGESENLGKFIKIDHGDGIFSIYGNLESIYVKENERVIRGQRVGKIGDIKTSYLHFELWINDEAVDPELYVDYSTVSI
ncbi:M23 family metallopeptidase [Maledivibacter halophilus]|uniref:Membrane proteins related to metalloendopeptidases n=1 Tax=Maledivibacter halophilus TaxID=36842 RepID=A0A1T5KLD7_9FIRM|nr:M23 family metallopeptidase [Maledivibacter halophilus]SKC64557.1 Membrane proteins related to metalloendopeptidases [Maledivibacter halophilus]